MATKKRTRVKSSSKNNTLQNLSIGPTVDELNLDRNSERELWIVLMIRGIALLSLGFTALIWPGITLVALAHVFAIFIVVIGVLDVVNGFRSLNSKSLWFLRVILGIAEIAVGLHLLQGDFVLTTVTFLQAAGLILLLQAIIETIVTIKSDAQAGLKFLALFSALIGFVVAFALLRYPVSSGLAFTWLMGLYGLLVGPIMIAASLAVRPSK